MKKYRGILFLSFMFILFFIKPTSVYASDVGYYIKNMNVDVKVNSSRQYIVTEKIDVYFSERKHGIIRKIPTVGSAESWTVSDVSVAGAPYTVTNGYNVEIKIGDKDKEIKGDKSYIIKYTLNHYADEEEDGDYLYLDVLGSQWDTSIDKFNSTIKFPFQMSLNDYKITSGAYGSKENKLGVKSSVNDNVISINCDKKIDKNNAITINAKFNEGDFSSAPKYQYNCIINSEETNIDITKNQEYIVKKSYSIDMNGLASDAMLPVLQGYESGSKLYDFKCSNDKIKLISENRFLCIPKEIDTYDFTVSYKIKPPIFSKLKFNLFSSFGENKIKNLKAVINSYVPINKYSVSGAECDTTKNNNVITITNKKNLKRNQSLDLTIDSNMDAFTRPKPKAAVTSLIFAAIIFVIAIILYFMFGRDEKLYHIVEFYPPDGISSVEAAYIMNGYCSNDDITSLIYYWASHNHIKIKFKDKGKKSDGFKLIMQDTLDDKHQQFEIDLFNSIFLNGNRKTVCSNDLKDSIYKDVSTAASSVKKVFKGEKSLYNKKSSIVRKLYFIVSFIPLIPLVMSRVAESGYDSIDVFFRVVFSMIGLILFYGITCKFNTFYRMNKAIKNIWIIFIVIMYFIIFNGFLGFYIYNIIPLGMVFWTVFLLFASFFVTAFLSKKSRYNVDIISRLLGFKEFMITAEKERLEALIEDDPEYFYNTLPYAQVLGVTDVWKDKFRKITMEPPSWYDGGFDTFDYFAVNRMLDNMNTVTSDMTSVPASSGFDGFDGGGFSGGGSGGGGGSSW